MTPDVIGVFIPIISVLVTGLVLVVYFYLKSKEKQMLIEKGLSTEEIKSFYEQKSDGLGLYKFGIIAIFFGIGLGIGLLSGGEETREVVTPASIFIFTGLGFVIANLSARKMAKKKE